MSCCAIKKNLAVDKSNSHIAEMMIQGTLMGVIQCQKFLMEILILTKVH